jgi:hypothetical protein
LFSFYFVLFYVSYRVVLGRCSYLFRCEAPRWAVYMIQARVHTDMAFFSLPFDGTWVLGSWVGLFAIH